MSFRKLALPCLTGRWRPERLWLSVKKLKCNFLCRQKVEQVPPLLPEGVQHTDPAWQRVHIKYLQDGKGPPGALVLVQL